MDLMTIIGYILGMGLLAYGASEGGGLQTFINVHGIVIVVGGTLAMMLVNSTGATLKSIPSALLKLLFPTRQVDVERLIAAFRSMADKAKVEGIGAMQASQTGITDAFMDRAINVSVITGDAEATREILEEEVRQIKLRHTNVENVFRTAGVLSPMIGLLGTLLGIVQVLQQITDPEKIGPSMAIALSTAFYGIFIASFIAVPIAGKLRERSNEERLRKLIIMEGVIGILKNESPYILELRLRSFAHLKTPGLPAEPPSIDAGPKKEAA
jgi:chemotaxis protein MotA